MTHDELCRQPISNLADLIARREISPLDLTDAYLERIERANASLNAFLTVTAELARQEAQAAEAEIASSGPRSPLHGIPLAHKDIVLTKQIRTTCGSKVLEHYVPDEDAAVIERLQTAGALMLGKLNMHEFATLIPSPYFGPAQNPWRRGYNPGGSSSGSGVAVAAGLCAGALGTDTGGSIRIPAGLLRHCRPQSHTWPHQFARRHPPRLVARSHWPHDPNRQRRRPHAASPGGLRPARSRVSGCAG